MWPVSFPVMGPFALQTRPGRRFTGGLRYPRTFLICFRHVKTYENIQLYRSHNSHISRWQLQILQDDCQILSGLPGNDQHFPWRRGTAMGNAPDWPFFGRPFLMKAIETPGWSEQLVTVVQQFIHVYDGQSLQIMLFSMNSQVCLQHYRLKISLQDFDGLPVPAVAAVAVTTSIWLGFITGSSLKLPTIHNNFFSIIGLG